ncbi:hypothetical protein M501DRAFT_1028062 [Patellaria atrata CBS 101060]|uniref:Velvet domain-containing protein n=1 Tax=Patellaria atrata CBS 101060 TaxID=1346257 RepID=A0A9P4SJ27_9PEZI|nr:hypothetical protein M501DRAFT_1028062 [Patellaria atrata CBS 101060]
MPRGRRRLRDSNQNNSVPRLPNSEARRRPIRRATSPLRRSARLANYRTSDNSDPPAVMTSVARRVGARAISTDHVRDRPRQVSRRSRENGFSHEDTSRYIVDVIREPPETAQMGRPLANSITVRVRVTHLLADEDDAEQDAGNILAFASLLATDANGRDQLTGNGILKPPHSIVRSLQATADDDDEDYDQSDSRTVGYASFPNLQIYQSGLFRLRISLRKIGQFGQANGALNLPYVDTKVINVENSPHRSSASENGDESLQRLRRQRNYGPSPPI